MIEQLYIFVEGYTDKLFIEKVFAVILSKLCTSLCIIEYAQKENKKINKYINTIKRTKNWDYIFIADQDGKDEKRQAKDCFIIF